MPLVELWRTLVLRVAANYLSPADKNGVKSFFSSVFLCLQGEHARFLCPSDEVFVEFSKFYDLFSRELQAIYGNFKIETSIDLVNCDQLADLMHRHVLYGFNEVEKVLPSLYEDGNTHESANFVNALVSPRPLGINTPYMGKSFANFEQNDMARQASFNGNEAMANYGPFARQDNAITTQYNTVNRALNPAPNAGFNGHNSTYDQMNGTSFNHDPSSFQNPSFNDARNTQFANQSLAQGAPNYGFFQEDRMHQNAHNPQGNELQSYQNQGFIPNGFPPHGEQAQFGVPAGVPQGINRGNDPSYALPNGAQQQLGAPKGKPMQDIENVPFANNANANVFAQGNNGAYYDRGFDFHSQNTFEGEEILAPQSISAMPDPDESNRHEPREIRSQHMYSNSFGVNSLDLGDPLSFGLDFDLSDEIKPFDELSGFDYDDGLDSASVHLFDENIGAANNHNNAPVNGFTAPSFNAPDALDDGSADAIVLSPDVEASDGIAIVPVTDSTLVVENADTVVAASVAAATVATVAEPAAPVADDAIVTDTIVSPNVEPSEPVAAISASVSDSYDSVAPASDSVAIAEPTAKPDSELAEPAEAHAAEPAPSADVALNADIEAEGEVAAFDDAFYAEEDGSSVFDHHDDEDFFGLASDASSHIYGNFDEVAEFGDEDLDDENRGFAPIISDSTSSFFTKEEPSVDKVETEGSDFINTLAEAKAETVAPVIDATNQNATEINEAVVITPDAAPQTSVEAHVAPQAEVASAASQAAVAQVTAYAVIGDSDAHNADDHNAVGPDAASDVASAEAQYGVASEDETTFSKLDNLEFDKAIDLDNDPVFLALDRALDEENYVLKQQEQDLVLEMESRELNMEKAFLEARQAKLKASHGYNDLFAEYASEDAVPSEPISMPHAKWASLNVAPASIIEESSSALPSFDDNGNGSNQHLGKAAQNFVKYQQLVTSNMERMCERFNAINEQMFALFNEINMRNMDMLRQVMTTHQQFMQEQMAMFTTQLNTVASMMGASFDIDLARVAPLPEFKLPKFNVNSFMADEAMEPKSFVSPQGGFSKPLLNEQAQTKNEGENLAKVELATPSAPVAPTAFVEPVAPASQVAPEAFAEDDLVAQAVMVEEPPLELVEDWKLSYATLDEESLIGAGNIASSDLDLDQVGYAAKAAVASRDVVTQSANDEAHTHASISSNGNALSVVLEPQDKVPVAENSAADAMSHLEINDQDPFLGEARDHSSLDVDNTSSLVIEKASDFVSSNTEDLDRDLDRANSSVIEAVATEVKADLDQVAGVDTSNLSRVDQVKVAEDGSFVDSSDDFAISTSDLESAQRDIADIKASSDIEADIEPAAVADEFASSLDEISSLDEALDDEVVVDDFVESAASLESDASFDESLGTASFKSFEASVSTIVNVEVTDSVLNDYKTDDNLTLDARDIVIESHAVVEPPAPYVEDDASKLDDSFELIPGWPRPVLAELAYALYDADVSHASDLDQLEDKERESLSSVYEDFVDCENLDLAINLLLNNHVLSRSLIADLLNPNNQNGNEADLASAKSEKSKVDYVEATIVEDESDDVAQSKAAHGSAVHDTNALAADKVELAFDSSASSSVAYDSVASDSVASLAVGPNNADEVLANVAVSNVSVRTAVYHEDAGSLDVSAVSNVVAEVATANTVSIADDVVVDALDPALDAAHAIEAESLVLASASMAEEALSSHKNEDALEVASNTVGANAVGASAELGDTDAALSLQDKALSGASTIELSALDPLANKSFEETIEDKLAGYDPWFGHEYDLPKPQKIFKTADTVASRNDALKSLISQRNAGKDVPMHDPEVDVYVAGKGEDPYAYTEDKFNPAINLRVPGYISPYNDCAKPGVHFALPEDMVDGVSIDRLTILPEGYLDRTSLESLRVLAQNACVYAFDKDSEKSQMMKLYEKLTQINRSHLNKREHAALDLMGTSLQANKYVVYDQIQYGDYFSKWRFNSERAFIDFITVELNLHRAFNSNYVDPFLSKVSYVPSEEELLELEQDEEFKNSEFAKSVLEKVYKLKNEAVQDSSVASKSNTSSKKSPYGDFLAQIVKTYNTVTPAPEYMLDEFGKVVTESDDEIAKRYDITENVRLQAVAKNRFTALKQLSHVCHAYESEMVAFEKDFISEHSNYLGITTSNEIKSALNKKHEKIMRLENDERIRGQILNDRAHFNDVRKSLPDAYPEVLLREQVRLQAKYYSDSLEAFPLDLDEGFFVDAARRSLGNVDDYVSSFLSEMMHDINYTMDRVEGQSYTFANQGNREDYVLLMQSLTLLNEARSIDMRDHETNFEALKARTALAISSLEQFKDQVFFERDELARLEFEKEQSVALEALHTELEEIELLEHMADENLANMTVDALLVRMDSEHLFGSEIMGGVGSTGLGGAFDAKDPRVSTILSSVNKSVRDSFESILNQAKTQAIRVKEHLYNCYRDEVDDYVENVDPMLKNEDNNVSNLSATSIATSTLDAVSTIVPSLNSDTNVKGAKNAESLDRLQNIAVSAPSDALANNAAASDAQVVLAAPAASSSEVTPAASAAPSVANDDVVVASDVQVAPVATNVAPESHAAPESAASVDAVAKKIEGAALDEVVTEAYAVDEDGDRIVTNERDTHTFAFNVANDVIKRLYANRDLLVLDEDLAKSNEYKLKENNAAVLFQQAVADIRLAGPQNIQGETIGARGLIMPAMPFAIFCHGLTPYEPFKLYYLSGYNKVTEFIPEGLHNDVAHLGMTKFTNTFSVDSVRNSAVVVNSPAHQLWVPEPREVPFSYRRTSADIVIKLDFSHFGTLPSLGQDELELLYNATYHNLRKQLVFAVSNRYPLKDTVASYIRMSAYYLGVSTNAIVKLIYDNPAIPHILRPVGDIPVDKNLAKFPFISQLFTAMAFNADGSLVASYPLDYISPSLMEYQGNPHSIMEARAYDEIYHFKMMCMDWAQFYISAPITGPALASLQYFANCLCIDCFNSSKMQFKHGIDKIAAFFLSGNVAYKFNTYVREEYEYNLRNSAYKYDSITSPLNNPILTPEEMARFITTFGQSDFPRYLSIPSVKMADPYALYLGVKIENGNANPQAMGANQAQSMGYAQPNGNVAAPNATHALNAMEQGAGAMAMNQSAGAPMGQNNAAMLQSANFGNNQDMGNAPYGNDFGYNHEANGNNFANGANVVNGFAPSNQGNFANPQSQNNQGFNQDGRVFNKNDRVFAPDNRGFNQDGQGFANNYQGYTQVGYEDYPVFDYANEPFANAHYNGQAHSNVNGYGVPSKMMGDEPKAKGHAGFVTKVMPNSNQHADVYGMQGNANAYSMSNSMLGMDPNDNVSKVVRSTNGESIEQIKFKERILRASKERAQKSADKSRLKKHETASIEQNRDLLTCKAQDIVPVRADAKKAYDSDNVTKGHKKTFDLRRVTFEGPKLKPKDGDRKNSRGNFSYTRPLWATFGLEPGTCVSLDLAQEFEGSLVKVIEPDDNVLLADRMLSLGSSTTAVDGNINVVGRNEISSSKSLGQFLTDDFNKLLIDNLRVCIEELAQGKYIDRKVSPYFVYGPSSSGKTHVVQAALNYAKRLNPDLRICYISASDFRNNFINLINCKDDVDKSIDPDGPTIKALRMAFKENFTQRNILVIEDIDESVRGDRVRSVLLEIIESYLNQSNSLLIMTARCKPNEVLSNSPDSLFRDRCTSFLQVALHAPTEDMLDLILEREALSYGLKLAPQINFIIRANIETPTILPSVMKTLRLYCKQNVIETVEDAAMVLRGQLRLNMPPARNFHMDDVMEYIAEAYGISKGTLCSRARTSKVTYARAIAMSILFAVVGVSYSDIARAFDKDHSSVMDAVNRIHNHLNDSEAAVEVFERHLYNLTHGLSYLDNRLDFVEDASMSDFKATASAMSRQRAAERKAKSQQRAFEARMLGLSGDKA